MSDTQPSQRAIQPPEKETLEMEPPPKWAIGVMSNVGELKEAIRSGFKEVDTRLTTIEANQTLTGGQVLDIGKRITAVEARMGDVEARQNTNSVRVKSSTDENLKQDQAIAAIVTDVATVKTDVAGLKESQAAQTKHLETIVDGGKALLKNPKFLLLLAALYAYAMNWLGKHGGVP